MKRKALLWFSLDLRIQDNAMIHWAAQHSLDVLAVVFEPNFQSSLQNEFYFRSVLELQENFQKKNIPFYVLKGDPVQQIPIWAEENAIDLVLTQDFYNTRDRSSLNQVEKILTPARVKTFFHQTLIEKEKLPFEISKMPKVFTEFRKLVEKSNCIAEAVPSSLDLVSGLTTRVPEGAQISSRSFNPVIQSFPFDLKPGESGASDRIQEYFFQTRSILNYKETRNGMLLKNDSSKISVALSCGCISVRTIFNELKKFEAEFGANESTEWFKLELLWRDYFKFLALKIGDQLFSIKGLNPKSKDWVTDQKSFSAWCDGQTQADFIDANMIELNKTGWMSNRGRQNAASYLAKTLKIDWTMGAKFFEQRLIDFDTESNWGNWLYVAGVGTDPRDRTFNFERQAEMYDPDFSYRKTWLR